MYIHSKWRFEYNVSSKFIKTVLVHVVEGHNTSNVINNTNKVVKLVALNFLDAMLFTKY